MLYPLAIHPNDRPRHAVPALAIRRQASRCFHLGLGLGARRQVPTSNSVLAVRARLYLLQPCPGLTSHRQIPPPNSTDPEDEAAGGGRRTGGRSRTIAFGGC